MRTRSANDLSLVTLTMFLAGIGLWIVYGLAIRSVPIVVWNAVSLALYTILLALRLLHGR
jgi:MtN3 and saliva related transmembrane protein